jgi:heme/copper-type cytochrome/quinol oxidase subunit 2
VLVDPVPSLPATLAQCRSSGYAVETQKKDKKMLIWMGTALTILGMMGIVISVTMVFRAKRAKLDDAAMRARISKVVPVNMGALFVSMIGLMMVVIGIFVA